MWRCTEYCMYDINIYPEDTIQVIHVFMIYPCLIYCIIYMYIQLNDIVLYRVFSILNCCVILQLEAIRAKQVHKAPPTFPHHQHHFQVLVTWFSVIKDFFSIVKDLRMILHVNDDILKYDLKIHDHEAKYNR